jgi:hypothetical protein
MKKAIILNILCLFILSCSDNTQYDIKVTACGCEKPTKNITWLKELIKKAETDKTGNYVGTIWLENYKGQEIFVTNMMLGSGGILYYFFDCAGKHLISKNGESYCPSEFIGSQHFFVEDEKDFETFMLTMKLNVVIYTNVPL